MRDDRTWMLDPQEWRRVLGVCARCGGEGLDVATDEEIGNGGHGVPLSDHMASRLCPACRSATVLPDSQIVIE